MLTRGMDEDERMALDLKLSMPKAAKSDDPDAPSWWQGDEAALVEARAFQSSIARLPRGGG